MHVVRKSSCLWLLKEYDTKKYTVNLSLQTGLNPWLPDNYSAL